MITLQNVSKTYPGGDQAVKSISCSINEGELLGLIGTSGSGKTTTLKMINRLIEPTSGTILINNQNVLERRPEELRRSIGYVIQHIGLFPHYSIRENLEVVPRLLGWSERRISERCKTLMKLVGLDSSESFMNKKPAVLSGGQQQRVGLARALAANPPIVLLDEPFGALDPITRMDIRREFRDLQQKLNKTMVMVTHDTAEAFELCDRLMLLDKGELQQMGTPKNLLYQPWNEFVKSFFNANRFMLEMLTISLAECIDQIVSTSKSAKILSFPAETPFLHVFRQIENESETEVTVSLERDGGKGPFYSSQDLLNGFYLTKKKLQQNE